MRRLTVLATLFVVAALVAPLHAQPRQADLRSRIEVLETEITELRAAAATVATLSQSVEELAARIAVISQRLDELSRQREAVPEAVTTIDALTGTVRGLERELEGLRTQVANIEQPSVSAAAVGGDGSMTHDGGFGWQSEDGRFSLRLGGYLQARYQLELEGGFDGVDVSTFLIRRGRFGASGHVYHPRLQFKLLAELVDDGAPLRDYYLDYELSDEITLRAGQAKLPFTRGFLTSSRRLAFLERSVAVDAFRYDRDVGVWLHGELAGELLHYYGGVSNGAGPGEPNDNIDVATMLRLELTALGDYFAPSFGDVEGTEVPSLVVGGAVVHDLVRLPERVSGVEVVQRDVDADGTFDNVRVISAALDAIFRYRGLELAVEGMWRQERWGTILEHSENTVLANAVGADASGVENYFGVYGQATYFVLPGRLLVGSRVGHARIPLLGVGGRSRSAPPVAPRALQIDGLVQLYDDGFRVLGLDYTFTNYDAIDGPDPAADMEHRFILETQLVW